MSQGLGSIQQEILAALSEHEVVGHPGVYDLQRLRLVLAMRHGKTWWIGAHGQNSGYTIAPTFAVSFMRAMKTLMARGILQREYGPLVGVWNVTGTRRMPYVRCQDKCRDTYHNT